MTLAILLLSLFAPPVRTVDICELNTICTCDGKPQASYWIWWELKENDYRVADWRPLSAAPFPDANRQSWFDNKTKRWITVEHRVYVEWHSNTDREVDDRKVWPEDRRRKL